jgi:cell division protein FtsB
MASYVSDSPHDEAAAQGYRERPARRCDASHASEDIWTRFSRLTSILIVLVGLGCSLVCFKPQLERRDQLKEELIARAAEYKKKSAEVAALDAQLTWLREDQNYLETKARDLLDLQKDGEQVIRVIRQR